MQSALHWHPIPLIYLCSFGAASYYPLAYNSDFAIHTIPIHIRVQRGALYQEDKVLHSQSAFLKFSQLSSSAQSPLQILLHTFQD